MSKPNRLSRTLLLLSLGALCSGSAFAGLRPSDCLGANLDVAVTPPAATSISDVVVTFSGGWCVQGGPELDSVEIEGQVIRIMATTNFGGFLVLDTFEVAAPLGSLPPGTYSVEFVLEADDLDFGPEVVSTTELVIAPAPDLDPTTCRVGRCPGATLLVPYFEVDLEKAEGPTTLLSVGNVQDTPTLSRVILWTNWGLPVLAFHLAQPAQAVTSINLRHVLITGKLPRSEAAASYPDCSFPSLPLDATALESLRARLTGQADPEDGLCYSGSAEGTSVATGYVTVDVMNRCSDTVLYPGDDGYFDDGGFGLASNRNVLWGDFTLLDGSSNRSEGLEAVALRADAARFGDSEDRLPVTFYGPTYSDNRAPLGFAYRGRFIRSAKLDATTDLLIWTDGQPSSRYPAARALPCGQQPQGTVFNLALRDETGANVGTADMSMGLELDSALRTQRLRLEDLDELTASPFGTVDVCTKNRYSGGQLSPPTALFQSWVVPVLRLRGRLSVAQHATQLERHPTDCY